ncbi:hypothetical protein [Thiohalocapsa marina]|uniref:hypothetical protein n=1 Tax=Thiohalocapsa marina TaxID=424902 RepID=UPI0014798366|nr:hypothetical protein [Thiohalocapsa marina]
MLHLLFAGYFPNSEDKLGHDYAFFIPSLLDGYLWFRQNGLLTIPWFSPSFCGGQAFFADPQSVYFSLPQLLTFLVDPLRAVYWSSLLMAAAGFWGMYVLCRNGFQLSLLGALVAATVFMFNGFFCHRMLAGHVTFQAFMLVPLTAFLLAGGRQSDRLRSFDLAMTLSAGLVLAYWLQSGMAVLVLPSALAVLALVAMLDIRRPGALWMAFRRGIVAAALALALCSTKLVGAITLINRFPHNLYPLPGLDSFGDIAKVALMALFMPSQQTFGIAQEDWRSQEWVLLPHEMAYGVTLIPLLVILVGLVRWARSRPRSAGGRVWMRAAPALAMLTLILLLPLALLFYSPGWNAVLKSLPVVGTTTAPIRWLIVLLPLLALWTGMALEQLQFRRAAALACILGVPLLTALEDRTFYEQQATFDPSAAVAFYQAVKLGEAQPGIHRIADARDPTRSEPVTMDALVRGESPLWCYNPLYGYRLEAFKPEPLREGPILQEVGDGALNLRNPACLLYPEENGCEPWDAFRVDQREQALRFASYRPFAFELSTLQRVANWVSLVALLVVVGVLLVLLGRWLWGRLFGALA